MPQAYAVPAWVQALWKSNCTILHHYRVSGSGLLCRTSLLAFLFTRPAFNRGRGRRFFEVFCGYGDQVPTCKITMRNKHAFSYCTYNWLHDFLVGVCSSSRAPLATLTLFPP